MASPAIPNERRPPSGILHAAFYYNQPLPLGRSLFDDYPVDHNHRSISSEFYRSHLERSHTATIWSVGCLCNEVEYLL